MLHCSLWNIPYCYTFLIVSHNTSFCLKNPKQTGLHLVVSMNRLNFSFGQTRDCIFEISLFQNNYCSSQDFLVSAVIYKQLLKTTGYHWAWQSLPSTKGKLLHLSRKIQLHSRRSHESPDIFYLLCACFQLLKALTEGFTDPGLQQELPCIITGLIKVLILIKMLYYCIMLNCSGLQPH